jgi:hypothetical protein
MGVGGLCQAGRSQSLLLEIAAAIVAISMIVRRTVQTISVTIKLIARKIS